MHKNYGIEPQISGSHLAVHKNCGIELRAIIRCLGLSAFGDSCRFIVLLATIILHPVKYAGEELEGHSGSLRSRTAAEVCAEEASKGGCWIAVLGKSRA
jgi:hypothetical protein